MNFPFFNARPVPSSCPLLPSFFGRVSNTTRNPLVAFCDHHPITFPFIRVPHTQILPSILHGGRANVPSSCSLPSSLDPFTGGEPVRSTFCPPKLFLLSPTCFFFSEITSRKTVANFLLIFALLSTRRASPNRLDFHA